MTKLVGSQIVANGVEVNATINDEVLKSVSNTLATSLMMSNETVSSFLSPDEASECFNYALKVVLEQDLGGKPNRVAVPAIFTDITMSLNAKYRGVRITVKLKHEQPKKPDSYGKFLDVMTSLGFTVGYPLRVNPFDASHVMEADIVEMQETSTVVSVASDLTIEEAILRSFLEVSKVEQEKVSRVIGHCEYLYVSRDELLRQWATTVLGGTR